MGDLATGWMALHLRICTFAVLPYATALLTSLPHPDPIDYPIAYRRRQHLGFCPVSDLGLGLGLRDLLYWKKQLDISDKLVD